MQQKKVNQKKSLLNMIKNELDSRKKRIKELEDQYNELEKLSKLPNVAKNLTEFEKEKNRLIKKNHFEKYQHDILKRMLVYRKSVLETYYQPINELNVSITKREKEQIVLTDNMNKLSKDMNDLEKALKDIQRDQDQAYEFCKNQVALEHKIWHDEIMFTQVMKNENEHIKKNVLNFLKDMAKLEKDNNEHIQSLKSKVEREKYENMKQVDKYLENLGELKRVIEVDKVSEVHEFYSDLENTNKYLEQNLEKMRELNLEKKTKLKELEDKLKVQEDMNGNLEEDKKSAENEMDKTVDRLGRIESEISHLEEPLDKILTCVGRM